MGLSRVVYAKLSQQIHLNKMMTLSGGICVLGYLLAALSPWAAGGLVGCALCGLGVGIMWPGTLSLTAEKMPARRSIHVCRIGVSRGYWLRLRPGAGRPDVSSNRGVKNRDVDFYYFPDHFNDCRLFYYAARGAALLRLNLKNRELSN